MKNQYLCDIGDFGKYALLRSFAKNGVKIGVNWYLTEDDGSNDGKMKDYLEKEDLRNYDPALFDALKKINALPDKTVNLIEEQSIIPRAVYYCELLRSRKLTASQREMERGAWFIKSLELFHHQEAELIFCDPDNGLTHKPVRVADSEKYVIPEEIRQYYASGKNVVYYCHKGRRSSDAWEQTKSEMLRHLPDAKIIVMTYRKGTQRSFIFVVHPETYQRYLNVLDDFMQPYWYRAFWKEPIYNKIPGDEKIGKPFEVTLEDQTVLTLKKRADGRIQIYTSDTPGTSVILSPEILKRRLLGR